MSYHRAVELLGDAARVFRVDREALSADSLIGKIIASNDEFLVLSKLNENGQSDGLSMLRWDHVSRLRWGDDELSAYARLAEDVEHSRFASLLTGDSFIAALEHLRSSLEICAIFFEELNASVCLVGQVKQVDSDIVIVHELGTYASPTRSFAALRNVDVTRIDVGGLYEEALKRLSTLHPDRRS